MIIHVVLSIIYIIKMGNTQTVYDEGLYIRPTKINNPHRHNPKPNNQQNQSNISSRSKSLLSNNKNYHYKSQRALQKIFGIDDPSLLRSYWQQQFQDQQNKKNVCESDSRLSKDKSIIYELKLQQINKQNQEDRQDHTKYVQNNAKVNKKTTQSKKQQNNIRHILSPINQCAKKLNKKYTPNSFQQEEDQQISILPRFSKNKENSIKNNRQNSKLFGNKNNISQSKDVLSLNSYDNNKNVSNFCHSQVQQRKLQNYPTTTAKQETTIFQGQTFAQHNQNCLISKQSSRRALQSISNNQKASTLSLQSSVVNIFNVVQPKENQKLTKYVIDSSFSSSSSSQYQNYNNKSRHQMETIISKLDQIYQITKNRQQNQQVHQFILNPLVSDCSQIGTIKKQNLTPRSHSQINQKIKNNQNIQVSPNKVLRNLRSLNNFHSYAQTLKQRQNQYDQAFSEAKNIKIWKLQQLQKEREDMYMQEFQNRLNSQISQSKLNKNSCKHNISRDYQNQSMRILHNNQRRSPSNKKQKTNFTNNGVKQPLKTIQNEQLASVRSKILYQNQHEQQNKRKQSQNQNFIYQSSKKYFKFNKNNKSEKSKSKQKCPTQYLKRIKQLEKELSLIKTQEQLCKYESRKCSPVKRQLVTPKSEQQSQNCSQSNGTIIQAAHCFVSKHRNKYFKLK